MAKAQHNWLLVPPLCVIYSVGINCIIVLLYESIWVSNSIRIYSDVNPTVAYGVYFQVSEDSIASWGLRATWHIDAEISPTHHCVTCYLLPVTSMLDTPPTSGIATFWSCLEQREGGWAQFMALAVSGDENLMHPSPQYAHENTQSTVEGECVTLVAPPHGHHWSSPTFPYGLVHWGLGQLLLTN